jgi:hypothetical protein
MASAAADLGLSTGLKNAQEILNNVMDTVQFAINEQCVTAEDTSCSEYQSLLDAGKPVFHIEYVDDNSNGDGDNSGDNGDDGDDNGSDGDDSGSDGDDNNDDGDDKKAGKSGKTGKSGKSGKAGKPAPAADLSKLCVEGGLGSQLSTVVKNMSLDGWVEYCDGSEDTTAINENYQTGDPKLGGDGKKSSA